jgi:hypothetical protein
LNILGAEEEGAICRMREAILYRYELPIIGVRARIVQKDGMLRINLACETSVGDRAGPPSSNPDFS